MGEEVRPLFKDYEFALCLTHDVDRPYKSYQGLHRAIRNCSPGELRSLLPSHNSFWQFETIRDIEDELGVRSAFYFLNEPHLLREKNPRNWLQVDQWIEHLGRYDVTSGPIAEEIRTLDANGWEVGLHGSYDSSSDRSRLKFEKRVLEHVVCHNISGVRQHNLRLDIPETWRHHKAIGLGYDTSLGSSTEYGFQHGYQPFRPFQDEFVVLPLTLMETALPDPAIRFDAALDACDRLLEEAAENRAVMTVLWHVRYFSDRDFPGYRRLYRELVERALDLGAWVGPPGTVCTELNTESFPARNEARRVIID